MIGAKRLIILSQRQVPLPSFGATFTPTATDARKTLLYAPVPTEGGMVVLPRNLPQGFSFTVVRSGSTDVEFVPGKDATVTHSRITSQGGRVRATVTSNADGRSAVWALSGAVEAATDADATAYFARVAAVATAYSDEAKIHWTRAIRDLKRESIWPVIDGLHVVQHEEEAFKVNVKSASFALTKSGTVTFTANRSWTGAGGATDYWETNFNPTTAGGAMSTDSSFLFVHNIGAANGGGTGVDLGNTLTRMLCRSGTSMTLRHGTSNTSTLALSAINAQFEDASGPYVGSRTDNANHKLSKDLGAVVTDAKASTGQTNATLRVGASLAREASAFAYGGGLTDAQMIKLPQIIIRLMKATGVYWESNFRGPPLTETDDTVLGTQTSQSIPFTGLTRVNDYRMNTGIHDAPAGTDGENEGAYNRVSRMAKATPSGSWEHVKFFTGESTDWETATDAVADGRLFYLFDDRLLTIVCYNGVGGLQTVYAYILDNPDAVKASLSWSGPFPLGYTYCGKPHVHNGEIRCALHSNGSDVAEPRQNYKGNNYGRLVIVLSTIYFEQIAHLPTITPHTDEQIYQPEFISYGTNSVGCLSRTALGPHWQYSTDGGASWTDPIPLEGNVTKPTGIVGFGGHGCKSAMVKRPGTTHGFVMSFHNSVNEREQLTVAVGEIVNNLPVIAKAHVFDADGETDPRPSEPDISFDPDDSNRLRIKWDKGRGKTPAGGPFINLILNGDFDCASLQTDSPDFDIYSVTS